MHNAHKRNVKESALKRQSARRTARRKKIARKIARICKKSARRIAKRLAMAKRKIAKRLATERKHATRAKENVAKSKILKEAYIQRRGSTSWFEPLLFFCKGVREN